MKETQIDEIRALLRAKTEGELRKLFYKKNGLPKQTLLSNDNILSKLGIDMASMNSLERKGVISLLGGALAYLRKQAKDAKLAWIDFEHTITQTRIDSKGETYDATIHVARHGFMADDEKIFSNADKYETIAKVADAIAKQTREIAMTTKVQRPD
jgi:hypothetical protein